uniref:Uncharacterized protein n=1 Tax=Romanomermis culicivorax TaxID=13658 RepID=A0A915L5X1_ROMCU
MTNTRRGGQGFLGRDGLTPQRNGHPFRVLQGHFVGARFITVTHFHQPHPADDQFEKFADVIGVEPRYGHQGQNFAFDGQAFETIAHLFQSLVHFFDRLFVYGVGSTIDLAFPQRLDKLVNNVKTACLSPKMQFNLGGAAAWGSNDALTTDFQLAAA